MPETAARVMLGSDQFATAVQGDIDEARRLGIAAVPCFVFNRRFAVSGAQGSAVQLQSLQQLLTN